MDAKLFQRMVDCNAEQSWELVRDVVAIQLMGKDMGSKNRSITNLDESMIDTLLKDMIPNI